MRSLEFKRPLLSSFFVLEFLSRTEEQTNLIKTHFCAFINGYKMCKFLYDSLLQAQMPSRLIYSNSEDLDDFNLLKSAKIEFFFYHL